jgi:hypothetical protein
LLEVLPVVLVVIQVIVPVEVVVLAVLGLVDHREQVLMVA